MTQRVHVMQKNFGKETDGTKAPYFDGTQPCAQVDPELFFPDNASEAKKLKRIVIPICRACSFQTKCLEYAINSDVHGIWAGTSDTDRLTIRKQKGLRVKTINSEVTSMLA